AREGVAAGSSTRARTVTRRRLPLVARSCACTRTTDAFHSFTFDLFSATGQSDNTLKQEHPPIVAKLPSTGPTHERDSSWFHPDRPFAGWHACEEVCRSRTPSAGAEHDRPDREADQ